MLNGSLWEAAVWFCFWTAQEERACPGEPRTSRVLHRVTGYPWQWGPEYQCQDNLALAGLCTYTGERQRQGDWQKVYVIHPHSPSSWLLVVVLPLKLVSWSQISSSPLSGQHPNIPRNAVVSSCVGAPSCIPREQNTQIFSLAIAWRAPASSPPSLRILLPTIVSVN